MTRRIGVGAVSFALLALLIGCGAGDSSEASAPAIGTQPTGTITVAAAASLTEAFGVVVEEFEQLHRDAAVEVSFASSSTLAQQILDGAPVDVFASADETNMQRLLDADLVLGEPVLAATNSLTIVVKPGNPAGVRSLEDLPRLDVVSLCGEHVPCGRFAQEALRQAGVEIPTERVTRGQNAKATLAAVAEGDADAAIVYATDAVAAGDAVEEVPIAAEVDVVATYPMAVLRNAANPSLAGSFLRFVTGPSGQAALRDAGFGPP